MSNWHNQCSSSRTISKRTYCIHIIKTQYNLCSLLSTSTRTTCPFNTACSLHKTLWRLFSSPKLSFAFHPALHRVTPHKYLILTDTLIDLEKKQIYFPVYSFPRSANTQRPPANEIHRQKKLTAGSCF